MHFRSTRPTVLALVGLTSVGVVLTCIAGPASAAPSAPTWDAVKVAKSAGDVAGTTAELTARLNTLQDAADRAAVGEQQAGQHYAVAVGKQRDAQDRARTLARRATTAATEADTSEKEAAALTVEMTRTGGSTSVTSALITRPGSADDTLYRVSAATRLTEHAADRLATAQADRRTAAALQRQATTAERALNAARRTAETTLADATAKATTTQTAVAEQQRKQQTVLEQLAYLHDSTVDEERQTWQTQRVTAAEAALPAVHATPPRSDNAPVSEPPSNPPAVATPPVERPTTPPARPARQPTAAPRPVPSQSAPEQPAPRPAPTKPPTLTPTKPAPTPSQAARVLSYARAQVGKPYVFATAGPNAYDCSGLVMAAYNSVGVATGGHNVVLQYNHFKSIGRLVPLAQRQPGDILFYSTDGTAAGGYHNGIYSGNGMMVEAANSRVGVVEREIWWPWQLLPYVARPTGSL
ncbi:NlpC/P60 family protein [Curtobacterium sp. MCSS17_016]|uniref:C40 family peptidase n=1 Tax=Curtobacterium sp. MCSS17_016 TaxID=2175644 RepID=UPI0011B6B91B|nr:NlpC/P60 family protein [Curtobacterium sp. MCSS17_016]WIE81222.1 NlpC/P60 family protein [Curtobacterium sp. MCSS17_016]